MLMLLGIALLGFTADVSAQVYRCGNTYSDEPCKGGKEVDASPAVSDPQGPKTKLIYFCSTSQGKRYWTAEECRNRGWTLERTERVPINMGWDDQVAFADRQKRNAAQAAMPSAAPAQYPQQQPSRKAQCDALDEQVKYLDSMGRAGSRLYDLDWIRRQRKEARDTQFRLRC
ncbi:DUF4124 domain-containing protein [Acidovorax sp. FJL06]|uniref:DUF4124 domain-containing protein n=1 Tax=Acidovorax sp. FJL06 TaxID=2153365 RepID=UPI000F586821|nr:DUF4124 domain-containing protein [Acidovorax sp. FJL06]